MAECIVRGASKKISIFISRISDQASLAIQIVCLSLHILTSVCVRAVSIRSNIFDHFFHDVSGREKLKWKCSIRELRAWASISLMAIISLRLLLQFPNWAISLPSPIVCFFRSPITQWYLGGQDGLISPNYRIRTKGIDRAASLHQIMLQFSHLAEKRRMLSEQEGISKRGGEKSKRRKFDLCFQERLHLFFRETNNLSSVCASTRQSWWNEFEDKSNALELWGMPMQKVSHKRQKSQNRKPRLVVRSIL